MESDDVTNSTTSWSAAEAGVHYERATSRGEVVMSPGVRSTVATLLLVDDVTITRLDKHLRVVVVRTEEQGRNRYRGLLMTSFPFQADVFRALFKHFVRF